MEFEHLQAAAEKITLSEDAQRRILDLERKHKKRYGRRKFVRRSLAASCAAALLFAGFSAAIGKIHRAPEWEITAYAKDKGGAQWLSLEPGERVLLEKDPTKNGYMVELDLPENYYYEKEIIVLGLDCIGTRGKRIFWRVCGEEEAEELPDVMSSSMYIRILDENREEVDRVYLEVTREYDDCYVQIKKQGEEQ